jgi:hypothetical protein
MAVAARIIVWPVAGIPTNLASLVVDGVLQAAPLGPLAVAVAAGRVPRAAVFISASVAGAVILLIPGTVGAVAAGLVTLLPPVVDTRHTTPRD